ncbi:hypothetical protein BC829DRAFT_109681 [Chytridium lagenaria]|nr:hypothetical protein BC829DRAFT_109681 [Chytridium lagenaria]
MIVLLSRARIGLYIIGNISYFDNKNNKAEHWTRTIQILSKPSPSDSPKLHESVLVYEGKPNWVGVYPFAAPYTVKRLRWPSLREMLRMDFAKFCAVKPYRAAIHAVVAVTGLR